MDRMNEVYFFPSFPEMSTNLEAYSLKLGLGTIYFVVLIEYQSGYYSGK